jgi:hypothetical protein
MTDEIKRLKDEIHAMKTYVAEMAVAVNAAAEMLDRPDASTLADADRWCQRTAVIAARRSVVDMPPLLLAVIESRAWDTVETGPTTLCTNHERSEGKNECAKCGMPLLTGEGTSEPVTAAHMVGFGIEEGFSMAAFMGVRLEAEVGHPDPKTRGGLFHFDSAFDHGDGAPPIFHEFARQLHALADKITAQANAMGARTVNRQTINMTTKGNN